MPKFFTAYSRPFAHHSDRGSDTVDEYELCFDENRVPFIVKSGSFSRSEQVNSYFESTNINSIMERCVLTDDYSALHLLPDDDSVIDLTQVPETRLDALKAHNALLRAYRQTDMKLSFDDFVDQLLSTSDSVPDPDSVPVPDSNFAPEGGKE